MKNTNFTIYLKTDKKTSNGLVPIYCKITCNGTTSKTFSLGLSVNPERWDKTQRLSTGKMTEDERKIKIEIDSTTSKLVKLVDRLEDDGKSYSAEMIHTKLFFKDETRNKSLLDAFDLHKKEFDEDIESGMCVPDSYKKYKSVRGKVEGFLALDGKTDIQLDELDNEFHKKFHKYLQTVKDKKGNICLGINQVTKYTYLFRHIVGRAVANKWLPEYPFIDRKLETEDVETTFLTEAEINLIYNKEFKCDRLTNLKNIFLFTALTGYSYAEVKRMEREKHLQLINGEWWIVISRQKTKVQEDVRLTGEALEIVNLYKDNLECQKTGKLFPVRSNQRMNEYLKEIADLCGIEKNLTCHVSRHTFGTTAINRDMDLKDVQKLMGHKTPRMTTHYAKILNTHTTVAMNKMEGVFQKKDEQEQHLMVA